MNSLITQSQTVKANILAPHTTSNNNTEAYNNHAAHVATYARNYGHLIDSIISDLCNPYATTVSENAVAQVELLLERQTPYRNPQLLQEVIDSLRGNTPDEDINLRTKVHELLDYQTPLTDSVLTTRIKEMRSRANSEQGYDVIANFYGLFSTKPDPKLKNEIDAIHTNFVTQMAPLMDDLKQQVASPSSSINHRQQDMTAQP